MPDEPGPHLTAGGRRPVVAVGVTCLLALLALPAVAAAAAAELPRPQIQQWELENGLDVIYLGVHRMPVVTVQVWYHAGSKDEPPDRRGTAHMFEHIMFKGTRHVPPEKHAQMIDKLGGDINGFTLEDATAYYDTVPKQYLDFAVRLEAERMQHLLFLPQTIDTEREVVKEEIRVRENHPILEALLRVRQLAFQRHPYAWDAGGRIADLDRIGPEDLERFYRRYYQPNNAALIVVGDVTAAELRASVERWFGAIPRAPAPPRPAAALAEPEQTEPRRAVSETGQYGLIIAGFKGPEAAHADIPALQLLAALLSRGESSRLYQRIVRRDKVGVFVKASFMPLEDPGLLLVFAAHLAPEQAGAVEKALLDELAELRAEPVGERELQKVKNQLTAGFVFRLQKVWALAWEIGRSWAFTGDASHWLQEFDRMAAVTPAELQRVACRYLRPQRMTLVRVPPESGQAAAAGGQP